MLRSSLSLFYSESLQKISSWMQNWNSKEWFYWFSIAQVKELEGKYLKHHKDTRFLEKLNSRDAMGWPRKQCDWVNPQKEKDMLGKAVEKRCSVRVTSTSESREHWEQFHSYGIIYLLEGERTERMILSEAKTICRNTIRVITSLHRKCAFLRELTAQIFASVRNQANSGLKVREEIRTHGADGASKLFPLLCYHIFYQRGRPSGQRSCPSYHLTGHSWGHTFPGHS